MSVIPNVRYIARDHFECTNVLLSEIITQISCEQMMLSVLTRTYTDAQTGKQQQKQQSQWAEAEC